MNAFDVDDELIREAFERRALRGDPAGLARSITELTARVPQSHGAAVRASSSMRLLAVAAVVVATAGLGLAIAGGQPRRPDATVPSPSALVELHQTTWFVRPFSYEVNVGSTLGPTTERADRFSVTARPPEDWSVVVVAASDARVHPCPAVNGGPSRVLIGGTPAEMLAGLQVAGGVAVGAIKPGTLDGRSSASAKVDARRNGCEYADLHVSTESLGSETMRFDVPSRLWITEVDGLPIVIQVRATTEQGLEAALPEGAALVESIRFTGIDESQAPVESINFVRPFTYRADTGEELAKMTRTRSTLTFSAKGNRETLAPEDAEWGITISTTRGAVMYTCEGLSQEPLREKAAEFLVGLESIGGVAVGEPAVTTFDGRDALVARIDPTANRCGPLSYHILDSEMGLGSSVGFDLPSRLTLTEVDRLTMVIQVWAGSEAALDHALPEADAFLEDVHFTDAATTH